jgi:hypothetical protein
MKCGVGAQVAHVGEVRQIIKNMYAFFIISCRISVEQLYTLDRLGVLSWQASGASLCSCSMEVAIHTVDTIAPIIPGGTVAKMAADL